MCFCGSVSFECHGLKKIMRSVLPGPMKYLGPLSTWLASYFVSKMSAKYEDVRSNASLEKARSAFAFGLHTIRVPSEPRQTT